MDKKSVTSVKFTADGSYKVTGIDRIKVPSTKEDIEVPRGKILLCGCGKSATMPRCDGAHKHAGFKSLKADDRIPTKDKDYYGKEITVHFDLAACAHVGYCVNGMPEVFDVKKRPWINPDQGAVDKIIEIVRKCPAGALSYTLKDQKRVDSFDSDTEIIFHKHGPYEFWGGIEVEGDDQPKVLDHYTLCACGKSKNHPYCDGKHLKK